MTDTPLRSGYLGFNDPQADRPENRDPEYGAYLCEEARRVYLEVMGHRLKGEADADAPSASQPRSRFL